LSIPINHMTNDDRVVSQDVKVEQVNIRENRA